MTDKPTECANGCPEKQVCDYCQSMDAALRLIAVNREVVELQERIRQLEQEVNAHRDNEEAFADELQSVSSVPAGQSVPVVGEPVAYACPFHSGMAVVNGTPCALVAACNVNLHGIGRGFPLHYLTHSIPAAELATLREKAAMVDELRKDAERYRWLRDSPESPIINVGYATDKMVDAAIAQGKGE